MQSLQEAGLVMVSASATNTALPTAVPNQTVFHRLVPDDDVQGKGVADYVSKRLSAKRAAYVHDNSEYGKGLADGTRTLLEGAGVPTVANETIDPRSQDFSAVVNRLRTATPDLIFYGGYYTEGGRLRKQLVDNGVRARFLSGDGSLDAGFVTAAGAAGAEGSQLTCACKLATEDAGGKLGDFAKAYRQLNNAAPGTYSTEGYDATNILIKGIKDGKTDRRALLDYWRTWAPTRASVRTSASRPTATSRPPACSCTRSRAASSPSWGPAKSFPSSSRPSTPASPVWRTSSGPRPSMA